MTYNKRKVLLISNKVFEYRIEIYNYFNKKFTDDNIEFTVLGHSIPKDADIYGNYLTVIKLNSKLYNKFIENYKPDCIIVFLHLKNLCLWSTYLHCKLNKIPIIYWSHGINLLKPNSFFRNIVFKFFHSLSDAIILYSNNEKKFIRRKYDKKIFVANNTINNHELPVIIESKDELRKKYNFHFKFIVLFVSRIRENKKLDILIEFFNEFNIPELGLLIVGPGMNEKQLNSIANNDTIKYLGAIYDKIKINEIYKLSDILCIPGANGLSINQAMFWGLPCLTLSGIHGPEVTYIKNNKNGYVLESKNELKEKILELYKNNEQYKLMSNNAVDTMRKEGDIDYMYQGFLNAINYILDKK